MTHLNKQFIEEQKEKLEKVKKKLEEELNFLAKKNKKVREDWIAKYPKGDSGKLDEETDEAEEYGNLFPIVCTLESDLEKIQNSLEKIKKGNYGICDKCEKKILKQRLEIYPQANTCVKCQDANQD